MFACKNIEEINHIKLILDTKFSIEDLGNIKYFLGFEIAYSTQGIFICQQKYNINLLQTTKFLGAKPINTPMDIIIKITLKLIHLSLTLLLFEVLLVSCYI